MKSQYRNLAFSSLFVLTVVVGCSGNDVATKRVKGVISFKGSPPPKAGGIVCTPVERTGDFPMREARGTMDASGAFTLTTYEEGDGIIPGKYRVKITCWRETPTLATSQTANYVPPDFGPEIVVSPDDNEPIAIAIDVPTLQGK